MNQTSSLTPILIRAKKRTRKPTKTSDSTIRQTFKVSKRSSISAANTKILIASSKYSLTESRTPLVSPTCHEMECKRGLSRLEILPPEILQHIFLYTCSTSLARASPLIGAKLSATHIYQEVCKTLFGTLCTSCGCFMQLQSQFDGAADELGRLRTEALKSRWLTWDVYEKHQESICDILMQGSTGQGIRDPCEEYGVFCKPQIHLGRHVRIPSTLLKYPHKGTSNFEFLRSMIESGATIDFKASLDLELAGELWYAAAVDHDYPLVYLLMHHDAYDPDMAELGAVQQASGYDFGLAWLFCHTLFPALHFDEVYYLEHYSEIPMSVRMTLAGNFDRNVEPEERGDQLLGLQNRLSRVLIASRPYDVHWRRVVIGILAHLSRTEPLPPDWPLPDMPNASIAVFPLPGTQHGLDIIA